MKGLYGWWMHGLEKRLTQRDVNRRVFPFEWGLDWFDGNKTDSTPLQSLLSIADAGLRDSPGFFAVNGQASYDWNDTHLVFRSPVTTPFESNNLVPCRVFPAADRRAAVVVVPQWNADETSHVGLCKILSRLGITAVRHCLPYHEERRLPGMIRAEYLVSPNVGRTLHAVRQAVVEVRTIVQCLRREGYQRIGIMGTSIGSCIGYLSFVHDPDIQAGVFNLVSSYFADVVWKGMATRYVRWGLEGNIDLESLRRCWAPISPLYHVGRLRQDSRRHLLITAEYDGTFLPELNRLIFNEYRRLDVSHDQKSLPCGHYTLARFPFSYIDGWHICRYLRKHLA